jgi:hypothetical protein
MSLPLRKLPVGAFRMSHEVLPEGDVAAELQPKRVSHMSLKLLPKRTHIAAAAAAE